MLPGEDLMVQVGGRWRKGRGQQPRIKVAFNFHQYPGLASMREAHLTLERLEVPGNGWSGRVWWWVWVWGHMT